MAKVRDPILVQADIIITNQAEAEKGIINALVAFKKQSQALRDADYSTKLTARQLRLKLEMKKPEFARRLGIDEDQLDRWENEGLEPNQIAHTMAFTGKVIDQIYRMLEFANGRADSRPDVLNLADMLMYLDGDQFDTFQKWVEAGKKRHDAEVRQQQRLPGPEDTIQ